MPAAFLPPAVDQHVGRIKMLNRAYAGNIAPSDADGYDIVRAFESHLHMKRLSSFQQLFFILRQAQVVVLKVAAQGTPGSYPVMQAPRSI